MILPRLLDVVDHQAGDVGAVATPARHFSGRALGNRRRTLWCGYAFEGPEHRVFFSGDTSMFPGLKEIGERLGPFDLTMLDAGAYAQSWADVHPGPEQTVERWWPRIRWRTAAEYPIRSSK